MKLKINYQESYSRGELLTRSFFGWAYIALPHGFLLFFANLWSSILAFITFWIILFTGRYPESFFNYQLGLLRWSLRVSARLYNVADGYPAFGISGTDEYTSLEVEYPERVSRGSTLVRALFGIIYVIFPHAFILIFRAFLVSIFIFIAWWVVLFTGRYPQSMFEWVVGQLRWGTRISLYMMFMTDKYPAFTGDELPDEK